MLKFQNFRTKLGLENPHRAQYMVNRVFRGERKKRDMDLTVEMLEAVGEGVHLRPHLVHAVLAAAAAIIIFPLLLLQPFNL